MYSDIGYGCNDYDYTLVLMLIIIMILMFVILLMVKVVKSVKGNNGGSCISAALVLVRLHGCC